MRLLVVEDEYKMAKVLGQGLEADGYSVQIANTGEEGFYLLQAQPFDMVILDVMLPGRDGLEILSTIRKRGIWTPVLLLTSRDALEDRVRGLDTGADDYLVKPFAFSELLARVRVLLRRGASAADERFHLADLEMEVGQHSVVRGGQSIDLTNREFEVLEYLFRNQGRVVSREMLARDVWREPFRQTPLDNVIDAQIVRLRRKMDAPFATKLLHTLRGVGFVLRKQSEP